MSEDRTFNEILFNFFLFKYKREGNLSQIENTKKTQANTTNEILSSKVFFYKFPNRKI